MPIHDLDLDIDLDLPAALRNHRAGHPRISL